MNKIVKFAAIVSLLFGLITIFAGGSVIFDFFGMRAKEGNYILFVVWANFICGFLYLFASYGFFKKKDWTKDILGIAIYILIAAFVVLIIWIINNKPFETKTIFALSFRILVTFAFYWMARRMRGRK